MQKNSNYLNKYSPKEIDELCIDNKKLSEIDNWFKTVYSTSFFNQRILVLYGPSGCCKTITIELFSKFYKVNLLEFLEKSQVKDDSNFNYVQKQIDQFESFLLSSNSFFSKKDRLQNKAILLEEIPSTFFKNSNNFHELLKNYLTISKKCVPIIFLLTINERNQDKLTSLFPVSIIEALNINVIELKKIRKTKIKSVLEKINCGSLNSNDIENISSFSNGDLRCAINAVEFLLGTNKNRSLIKNKKINSILDNSLLTIKDDSLNFFHTLGKILYCKREGDDLKKKNYCKTQIRRKLNENPQNLADSLESTGDNLACFIFENYLDFLNEDLSLLCGLIDNFTFTDSKFSQIYSWQHNKLEDYMKILIIRGTMFHLNTEMEMQFKKPNFFKSFKKPKLNTIPIEEENFKTNLNKEFKKDEENQFRSKQEILDIVCFKNSKLFEKLINKC